MMKQGLKILLVGILVSLWALSIVPVAEATHGIPSSSGVTVAARIPPTLTLALGAASVLLDFTPVPIGSGTTVTGSMTADIRVRLGVPSTPQIQAQAGGDLTDGVTTIPISRVTGATSAWSTLTGSIAATAGSAPLSTAAVTVGTSSGNGQAAGTLSFSMVENAADVPSTSDYTASVTVTLLHP